MKLKRLSSFLLVVCMCCLAACDGGSASTKQPTDTYSEIITSSVIEGTSDNNDSKPQNSQGTQSGNSSSLTTSTITSTITETISPQRRPDKPVADGKDIENNKKVDIPVTEIKKTIKGETGITYNLVWNDEFTGKNINKNKWCYPNAFTDSKYTQMLLLTEDQDSDVIGVSDGFLKMNAKRYYSSGNSQIQYATAKAFGTQDTMNLRYGYVEMRAKVPYKKGAFGAFWAIGKPSLTPARTRNYYVEIDFFECFGSQNEIWPNVHKWYDKANPVSHSHIYPTWNTVVGNTKYGKYTFDNYQNLSDEYHLYAFEWTPKFIKMYVDGKSYATFDIEKSFDAHLTNGTDETYKNVLLPAEKNNMDGFHDYIYLLWQNLIYTPDLNDASVAVNKNTEFPFEYWIDYVRVYQDPNNANNGLLFKDNNGKTVDYYNK
ncbi:MAG: glycoside hydrolase family 16 protein [Clostridia bacterium]|nr:glycoside hydrolase family 16 protein [Clostridia bacterium]